MFLTVFLLLCTAGTWAWLDSPDQYVRHLPRLLADPSEASIEVISLKTENKLIREQLANYTAIIQELTAKIQELTANHTATITTLSKEKEDLVKDWSMVQARSAIEYFEDAFGMDSDISTEDVTKIQNLIKKSDAVRKTRGEKIYLEKVNDQLKIYRRAALWYKILHDENTMSYPATILVRLIKTNKEPPNTKPQFSLCIAQAYNDLYRALIHPAILKRMTGSKLYDVDLAGCSSAALKILLSIYSLNPPSRSTDTS